MPALCHVARELYAAAPQPDQTPLITVTYAQPTGLRRREQYALEVSNDWSNNHRERFSDDNGRTWGPWQAAGAGGSGVNATQGDLTMEGGQASGGELDPAAGRRVAITLQRILKGDPATYIDDLFGPGIRRFSDHCFYQVCDLQGQPCAPLRMLRYEAGAEFDPTDWGRADYWRSNELYPGSMKALPNGTVVVAMTVPTPIDDPRDKGVRPIFPADMRPGCTAGAMTFVGRWNPSREDYDWRTSNRVAVPLHVSSRGLVELAVTPLRDGRLLMVMRGSNSGLDPAKAPGNKWITLSSDGGLTWSPVRDFRYDTGEPWYSSASISHCYRNSKTGRLYFVGNMSDRPTQGNLPRCPLQIAEIDETTATIRKETVTVIDDRDPAQDQAGLMLSNFCLLEDRATQDLEIYMPRCGARGGSWGDVYKYTLRF